ncbi:MULTISPECIES: hypothetical protein [Actinosynnema]|uniref:hypothetical protein n=1 Tax=Actinosynnema TaxID=40566 RepID=UPI0015A54D03|nr:hypothetical protein [Actinosynnema pretiosum]
MLRIIAVLLALWLVLAVLGALLKGVFWLVLIGGTVFLGLAAYGAIKSNTR